MSDPIINYLRSNSHSLITYFVESIRSQPDLFPTYSSIEPYVLHQAMFSGYLVALQALESGEFEEVKADIHQAFTARIRSGFDPNELLRVITLTNDGLLKTLEHLSTTDEALRTLYLQRNQAIGQVAKMYIAILNLSIPSAERNTIDPSLLELAV